MKNSEKPAFPCSKELCEASREITEYPHGLTKREYFAAMAMQGILSNHPGSQSDVCYDAVKYANELLKQLEND